MYDLFEKMIFSIAVTTMLLWTANMTGELLIPRMERAGAPPEIPLTPIYRTRN